ncbi:MATE family efflux transporter [Ruminiclostridium cellulolyticum]|uniref:MATE efflux family protein n=1 Tax=Ruminiclostridium cellulolyticum (strain ATCC 35319 / DSM 5812 / JCM 6584 / H10) TaxID=394503 RepID=B8I8N6_RUMCH|nr:MATE family efflux transporter [Ruminiclostridium cellulolyticum]ACL75269.1 MATE efflux family protein [Ruminiclostridium cellulolyticum H10]
MQSLKLKNKEFYLKLFSLALPITIQNLISSSLGVVDSVMVGSLGNQSLAAVGVANQYGLIVFLLYNAIHSGCGIYVAQFWGKNDHDNIGRVVNLDIAIAASVSLILSAIGILLPEQIISVFNTDPVVISQGADFLRILSMSFVFASISFGFSVALRSIGKSTMPMIISASALALNTILNYILIYGRFGMPQMGVRGSATSTLIARIVEMILFLIAVSKYFPLLKIRVSELMKVTKDLLGRVTKTMIPVILNEMCWGLGTVVYSIAYGRISTEAFDAVQITNNVVNLFTVAAFGMASAAAVMTGHVIGAGEEKKGRQYAWGFVRLCIIGGFILGGLLYLFSPSIVSLFKVSSDVLETSIILLAINAIILPIRFTNIVAIVGVLRGGGDASFAFIAEGMTMWLIGVPLSFIGAFVLRLDVQWVVLMVMAEEIVKMICGVARLRSNKWIKNVVREI